MTRCSPFAATARGLLAAAALSAVGLAGCASGGGSGPSATGTTATASTSASFSYGYMIPGNPVASTMGISSTDTIAELTPRSTVPGVVVNGISQEVASGRWSNGCTRRFGGPSVYVVVFYRACDASLGPEAEPAVVVGFNNQGRVIGRVQWQGPRTVTLMVPARRV